MTALAISPQNHASGQPKGLVVTATRRVAARDVALGDIARLRGGNWREVVGVVRGDQAQTVRDFAAAVDVELEDLLRTQLQPGLGMVDWAYVSEEEFAEVGASQVLLITWYAPIPGRDDIQWVANRLDLDDLVEVQDRVIDLT